MEPMNKINFLIIFYFAFLWNVISGFSQTTPAHQVLEFEAFHKQNYQETIYIHADKRYYLTGEFVKFKVYCLERLTSRPSRLSRVAYVELLDHENKPALQARIELKEGTGYGEIYIPLEVNSGNFILRGYTQWMRNYGPESFYHSMVTIINPFKKPGLKPEPLAGQVEVLFFPEGGKLIHGIKSAVVFQAKNVLNKPIHISGRILANDTLEVASFDTQKNGLGKFELLPDLNYRYHLEIIHNQDTTIREFVHIESRGFLFHLRPSGDNYLMQVFCNEPAIAASDAQLNYVAHQKGKVLSTGSFKLDKGRVEHRLDTRKASAGVITVSLFNANAELLDQKTVFHQPVIAVPGHLSTDKQQYATREKVTLDLANIGLLPVLTGSEFSVSVSAIHPNFKGNTIDLDQYLLLDNALPFLNGIEEIISDNTEESKALINDLLIAYPAKDRGKEFSRSAIEKKYLPEYRCPLITAKVINKNTKEPGYGIVSYLSVPGKRTMFYAARSTSDGTVVFETSGFYDKNEIVVQTDYTKDSVYIIEVDNPYAGEYAEIELPVFDLDPEMEQFVRIKSQNMQVQNANVKLSPNTTTLPFTDSTTFYNQPDARYYLDDYTRFVVMEEVMREYVAGVNVRKNRDGFYFMVVDIDRNILLEPNPLMLLDGVPVFDADEIIAIDPLKVEKIETVKTRFGKGALDCMGIVSYTTYAGDLAGHTFHENASIQHYDGLQTPKLYHFPVYSNAYERRNPTPDFRNTLYWLPEHTFEEDLPGFYTSDDADEYEVRINGISADNNPYSLRTTFRVNRQPSN
jgi:hypothetical protein